MAAGGSDWTWWIIDCIVSGKCVLNVMIAHDVFSERIAEAPNAEEEQWEKIKLIITDATFTGIRFSTILLPQLRGFIYSIYLQVLSA